MKRHDLVYLLDKKCFIQGSKRLNEEQAYKFFVQYKIMGGTSDFDLINKEFEQIKQLGLLSKDVMGRSSSLKDVLESVYQNMPRLSFRWLTNVEGSLYIFKVDGRYPNEMTKLNGNKADDILNSMKSNAKEYKELYDYYISNPELAAIKPRPEFATLFSAIYEKFISDSTYQIKELPKLVSDKIDEPCFKYVDKLNILEGPTPAWNEFLDRLDYPEVFLAWIGALFDPENEGRQVMWLQGNGFDGKSKVADALREIYGAKYVASIGQDMNQFFYSQIYGKRFSIYGDCQHARLVSTAKIQAITGADPVAVEYKGETPFTAKVYSRILVCSNINPEIDFNKTNEKSRVIRLFVKKNSKDFHGDPHWDKQLISEAPQILYKAFEAYQKLAPKRTNIVIPSDLWEKMETECGSDESSVVDEFVESCLIIGENVFQKKKDVLDALIKFAESQDVSPSKVPHLKNDLKQRLNKQGIKNSRKIIDGKKCNVYAGVKLKGVLQ